MPIVELRIASASPPRLRPGRRPTISTRSSKALPPGIGRRNQDFLSRLHAPGRRQARLDEARRATPKCGSPRRGSRRGKREAPSARAETRSPRNALRRPPRRSPTWWRTISPAMPRRTLGQCYRPAAAQERLRRDRRRQAGRTASPRPHALHRRRERSGRPSRRTAFSRICGPWSAGRGAAATSTEPRRRHAQTGRDAKRERVLAPTKSDRVESPAQSRDAGVDRGASSGYA